MTRTEETIPRAATVQLELKRRIIDGTYKPHSYLPPERVLAEDLGTSRTSIAHALGALEQDGLVERNPRKGTRVVPLSENLVRPVIAVVHGEVFAAARADSLRTTQGARDALSRLGHEHELVFLSGSDDSSRDNLAQYGAMILIAMDDSEPDACEARDIPFVAAKFEGERHRWCTYVDHHKPMLEGVRNLTSLGHRRIAFVTREPTYAQYGKARQGYVDGLNLAGIPVDESLIAICNETDALSGYFATKPLLKQTDPPTAILVARDCIAEGVCRAVEEMGMELGRDVSVIGFDDITWPAGREFLTTFREPCYEMGVAAAEMLVDRITNPSKPLERRAFDTPFVLRRTAGPPKQSGRFFTAPLDANR